MKLFVPELIAWGGVGAILTAYIGVSSGYLDMSMWIYHALNAIGALILIVSSTRKKHYQPLLLNAVWFIVAVIALGSLAIR